MTPLFEHAKKLFLAQVADEANTRGMNKGHPRQGLPAFYVSTRHTASASVEPDGTVLLHVWTGLSTPEEASPAQKLPITWNEVRGCFEAPDGADPVQYAVDRMVAAVKALG